jgi:ligand-binding SRPBCC domain-containing protein
MSTYTLRKELWVPYPLEAAFDFFSKPENLERITPPWLNFRIVTPSPIEMKPGAKIQYKLRVRGIPIRWLTVIERWDPPHEFVDVQAKGPYKLWHHTHRFYESRGGTMIEDCVRYQLPFGVLGRLVHWLQVKRDVEVIFQYRAQNVERLLHEALAGAQLGAARASKR